MHQALEISQYWRYEGGFQAENKISLFIATGFLWNQKEGGGGRQGEKDGGDKDQEKGKREDLPHVLWLQEGHSHCGMKLVNKSTLILLWTGGFQRLKHELNLNYSFNLTLTGHSSPRVWVAQDHIERLFFPQLYRRLESSLHTNDCISPIFCGEVWKEKKNVLLRQNPEPATSADLVRRISREARFPRLCDTGLRRWNRQLPAILHHS